MKIIIWGRITLIISSQSCNLYINKIIWQSCSVLYALLSYNCSFVISLINVICGKIVVWFSKGVNWKQSVPVSVGLVPDNITKWNYIPILKLKTLEPK